ncbi:MAG: quaternary ammonium transporter [Actinomycetota bacterium]|nr:quaternary ammonium transporter [Actinomycetota bacterium]
MRAVRPVLVALIVVTALVWAGCGGGNSEPTTETVQPAARPSTLITRDDANARRPVITFSSKNFTEEFILGEIYTQALRAAGYRIRKKLNIGDEEVAYKALRDGEIDAYPEYIGTALTNFCGVASEAVPKVVARASADLRECVAKEGVAALPPTPFTDSNGFAMTEQRAQALGIRKLSDLKGKAQDLVLSGSKECRRRPDCKLGLEMAYGLRFKQYSSVDLSLRHEVLTRGLADVSVVFTTDGQIRADKLRLLVDDKGFLPPYNVSLLIRDDVLRAAGPGLPRVVAQVQRGLTTRVMQELNSRVDLDNDTPEQAAKAYLQQFGLIAP